MAARVWRSFPKSLSLSVLVAVTDTKILYINGRGMTWQCASGTEQCGSRNHAIRSPESPPVHGSRLFCVTSVSIVCTIKAPVPVRAEDGLDSPYLHGR